MELAIGTAQFGSKYGVSNSSGCTSPSEVRDILDRAQLAGIETLDTAAAYGESENVLGSLGVRDWNVISKVPPLPDGLRNGREWIVSSVYRSLARLKVDHIDGVLLHKSTDILTSCGEEIVAGLMEAKARGLVRRVGYSIYSPEQLPELLGKMAPDLIQAPLNVLDQRLRKSGWLDRLADAGIEVHTRSAFLQGLLLMPSEIRPKYFAQWGDIWEQWETFIVEQALSPLEACLSFVKGQPGVSKVVVGVQSLNHLSEVLFAWERVRPIGADTLSCNDRQLLEPVNWLPQ